MRGRFPFGTFLLILFIPIILFGSLFTTLIKIILIAVVVAIIIYFARILIESIVDRRKENNKQENKELRKVDDSLGSYFTKHDYFYITSNISLCASKFNDYNDLYICYYGRVVDKLSELDDDAYDKIYDVIGEYTKHGKEVTGKSDTLSLNYDRKPYKEEYTNAGVVSKPEVAEVIGEYNNVFEAFKNVIENVSYGSQNASDYVKGHKQAIDECYKKACEIDNLCLLEEDISKQIESCSSSSIHDKGYYDGLFYCLKAIKKAKAHVLNIIAREINNDIR